MIKFKNQGIELLFIIYFLIIPILFLLNQLRL